MKKLKMRIHMLVNGILGLAALLLYLVGWKDAATGFALACAALCFLDSVQIGTELYFKRYRRKYRAKCEAEIAEAQEQAAAPYGRNQYGILLDKDGNTVNEQGCPVNERGLPLMEGEAQ